MGEVPVLGIEEIAVHRLALKVEPAQQTVPKNIATLVSAYLQTGASPENIPPLSDDAEVRATLRGPSFPEPLELAVRPNTPINIPPLSVAGLHSLENIRLISNGEVLLRGSPESVTIDVIEKILVTQVTARALTAEEIRERGIVFDSSSYQAFNFAAAFAIGDGSISVEFPVVVPLPHNFEDDPAAQHTEVPTIDPPQMGGLKTLLPDTLKLQTMVPNLSVVGFVMEAREIEDQSLVIPPIPGVVVIPGDIGFLNQFFSVMLMVANAAPDGSDLVVSNVSASIVLPPGKDGVVGSSDDPLVMGRTSGGPSPRTRIVVQPGPDGRLGTADDIATLGPGETGNAEYLVEGKREGNHTVEMDISAMLQGLPIGPVPIRGRAIGSVLVKNPNFTLTFTHPEVVNAGEKYSLDVTVSNTSTSPANFVSLNIYPRNVSGVKVIGSGTRQIETIPPGDSAVVSFELLSLRTGRVTAATLDADSNVAGRFSLKAAVGELGIPLSPESLVLPKEAAALPANLREAIVALLGKAYAVATAPPAALPSNVRRFSKKIVFDRAVEAAEAGFGVRLHEPKRDAAAQLLMSFAGSNYAQLPTWYPDPDDLAFERNNFQGFDELRRRSVRGDAFASAVAAELGSDLDSHGVTAFHEDLAEKWAYRPGHISVLIGTAGTPLPFAISLIDSQGRGVGGVDVDGKVVKEAPFGDYLTFTNPDGTAWAQMAILAAPESGDYTLRLEAVGGVPESTPYTLSLIVPTAAGGLRQIAFHDMSGRAPPEMPFTADDPYRLSAEVVVGGIPVGGIPVPPSLDRSIADPAPTLLGVVQQAEADVISCPVDPDPPTIPVGRVVAALFSKQVTPETAEDVSHYVPENNKVVAAALQPGGRIVYLALRDPIGPFEARDITVDGIADKYGQTMASRTLPIETTMSDEAGVVSGRILNADGTTIPYADVRLFYWLDCELAPAHWVGVSAKAADLGGRYSWDYVSKLLPARIVATDPNTEEGRDLRFAVQRNGQRLNVDVVLLGRGTFQGTTRAEDGTLLQGTLVKVTSLTDSSEYSAQTDSSGRFAIYRVPVGSILVEAVNVAAHARITLSEQIPLAGSVVDRDITLLDVNTPPIVVKKGDLDGYVFRADGVTPADYVPVIVYYESGSQPGVTCSGTAPPTCGPGYCAIAFDHTGNDGAYAFDQITAGRLCVYTFDQEGLQQGAARVVLPNDGFAQANVLLSGGLGSVRGVVVDAAGTRVAEAQVGGGLSLTTSDANGEFLLPDVPVGRRDIVAVSQVLQTSGRATVDITRPGEQVNVTIVLDSVGSVAGLVTAPDGVTPVAGNKVYLFTKRYEPQPSGPALIVVQVFGEATTNAQGRYRIDGVRMGQYEVSAFRPDFSDGNIVAAALQYHRQVFKADIKFRGGGGRIIGTVLAADGATPLKARVSVSGDRVQTVGTVGVAFRHTQNYKIVDSDLTTGAFTLEPVLVGPFVLRAAGQFSPDPIVLQGTMPAAGATVEMNVRLKPTSEVAGTVYLSDGVTPAGADVVVTYRSSAFQVVCTLDNFGEETCHHVPVGIQNETVVTDSGGRFWFPIVNGGSFSVTAEDATTGALGQAQGAVRAGERGEVAVRLLGIGELTVKVMGADGTTPIPGAKVAVTQLSYPQKRVTLNADAQGTVVFTGGDAFTEGDLIVAATDLRNGFVGRADGRITHDGETVTVNVYLYDATGTVYGTVFRQDHLTRVPNAEYVLSNAAGALAFGVTDSNGEYSQGTIPLGPFKVEVFEAATARRGATQGQIDLNGQQVPANVFEDALGVVRGTALQVPTLAPLKGWEVTLVQTSPSGRVLPSLRATSGVDGGFSFPGVSQGVFRLTVKKVGEGEATAQGRIDREGQVVSIPLLVNVIRPSYGRIEGTVFGPDGNPAGDSLVETCYPGRCVPGAPPVVVTAASDGTFALAQVPLGRFSVTAKSQVNHNVGTAFGELQVDGDIATVNVVLVGLTEIQGNVEHSDGLPAAGVEVVLTGSPSSGCAGPCTKFTNAAGAFSFFDVPARTFTITARDVVSGLKGAAGGLLEPGQTATVRIVLEPTARVEGRVLLARGTPAGGIVTELVVGHGATEKRLYLETTMDGLFAFEAAPLGDYRLNLFDPIGPGVASRSGQLLNNIAFGDIVLDEAPPAVASVTPANATSAVPLDQSVRLAFTEAIAPGTITADNVALSGPNGAVAAVLEVSGGDKVVTLDPLNALHDETLYTLRVRGVQDRVGKTMQGVFTVAFTTVDVTPPGFVELSPAPNVSGVPIESTVRIKLSEAIDPSRFNGPPVLLTAPGGPVEGRIDYLFGNTVLVFTPLHPLAEDTTYRVQTRPATDLAGNVQSQGADYLFLTTDRTPPEIQALIASNNARVIEGDVAHVVAQLGGAPDVAFVDFYLNGVLVLSDRVAPYELNFQATPELGQPGANIQVSALATDTSGNRGTTPAVVLILVLVDQPPSVAITSPADGTIAGNGDRITVSVHVSDDLGVKRAGYRAQTGQPQDAGTRIFDPPVKDRTETFGFNIPANAPPGSSFLIDALAADTKEHVVQATPVRVVVRDATPPVVLITGASTGQKVVPGQQTTVVVKADDLGGVTRVSFNASGAATHNEVRAIEPSATSVAVAFTFLVPASARPNDSVSLDAEALDQAGNRSTAPRLILPVADTIAPTIRLRAETGSHVMVPGQPVRVVAEAEDEIAVARIELAGSGAFTVSDAKAISPPAGSATATFTILVPVGLPEGAALNLAATARDVAGNTSQPAGLTLTVTALVDVLLPPSDILVAGESKPVAVQLAQAAPPGGLRVDLTADNVQVATVVPSVFFAEGESAKTATVTGVAGGTTYIVARVQGVQRASMTATVRGGVVSGTVYDLQFNPVVGVQVTVSGGTLVSTVSDAQGRYTVEGITGPGVAVKAFDPASKRRGFSQGSLNRPNGFAHLNVVLISAGIIRGRVLQADAETPVRAGVRVDVFASANLSVALQTTFTREDGSYEFPLLGAGTYVVEAAGTDGNRGRSSSIVITDDGEDVVRNVVYLGRGTVQGTVLDGAHKGVPNALFSFRSSSLFGTSTITGSAGPDGGYHFEKVFVGSFTIGATDPRNGLSAEASGVVTRHGDVVTQDVKLPAYGSLQGIVYRSDHTTTVAGASVSVHGKSTATDSEGRFAFAVLPLGAFTVSANEASTRSMGRAGGVLDTHGQVAGVDVTFFGQGTVAVTVKDADDQLVAGASVGLNVSNGVVSDSLKATTGPEGIAVVPHVLAGNFIVTASRNNLAASVSATLAEGEVKQVLVRLPRVPDPPTASIAGTVFAPDGQTPANGGHVMVGGSSTSVSAQGAFRIEGLSLGSYSLTAFDAQGRRRARLPQPVVLSERGQLETRTLTFVGLGRVQGRVLNPDSSGASGITVSVRDDNPGFGGTRSANTNAAGYYALDDLAVGGVTATVSDPGRQLFGEGTGAIARDGETAVVDVLLEANVVSLPLTRYDGNNAPHEVQKSGAVSNGVASVFGGAGLVLDVVAAGSVYRFEGAGTATGEEGNHEIVVRQTLAGLEATRKVYVPQGGYFARYLEILTNTTAGSISVAPRVSSRLTSSLGIVSTSSGDTLLDVTDPANPDRWVTLDDATDVDPFLQPNLPSVAFVFDGPGAAARVASAQWAPSGPERLGYQWAPVALAPGESVGYLHFAVQQLTRASAMASAQRLVDLPPEALVGLSVSELGAIANFVAPPDGVSAVAPLPLSDGSIVGRVFEGDGVSAVPGATVRFRSHSLFFGRTHAGSSDGSGEFGLTASLSDSDSTRLVPIEDFTLEATHPASGIVAPPVDGLFEAGQSLAIQDIAFTNAGLVTGLVKRHNNAAVTGGGSVRLSRPAPPFDRSVPIASDARYAFAGVPVGTFDVTASIGHPQGTGLSGTTGVSVSAGLTATANVTIEPTGTVRGMVRRGTGPVASVDVYLSRSGFSRATRTDTAGEFFFSDVPSGTFTLRALDPQTGLPAVTDVIVVPDQTSTRELALIGLGTVKLHVDFHRGVPAPDAAVHIRESARGTAFRAVGATDAAGWLTIPNVTTGTFTVRVFHPWGSQFLVDVDSAMPGDAQLVSLAATLPPVAALSGRVARADGSPVAGTTVTVRHPQSPPGESWAALTNAQGTYRVAAMSLGAFSATVFDLAHGLFGESFGALTQDGEEGIADITLLSNPVALPRSRYDANGLHFDVRSDGAIGHGTRDVYVAGAPDQQGGALLEITSDGATVRFTGREIGTLEEDGQEIATLSEQIAGLVVSRKVFVPRGGYFARYLEILRNETAAPINVDIGLASYVRARTISTPPAIFMTSSGDAVLDVTDPTSPDRWVVIDDDRDEDPFEATSLPATGFVFDGLGAALSAGAADFSPATPARLGTRWTNVTVPAGETVAVLHFVVQQLSRAAAQASAERLAQLPPEALAGLSAQERAWVRNFAVPADGTSTLPPLPSVLGTVSGRVLAVDGATTIPGASVRLRSDHALFGRNRSVVSAADGAFSVVGHLADDGTSIAVPVHAFTLQATHPLTGVVVSQGGAFQGTTAQQDIVFSNTGMLHGFVRRHTGVALPGQPVAVTRSSPPFSTTVTTDAQGRYRVTGLTDGTYALAVSVPHPQGSALSGAAVAEVAVGQSTPADITLVASGAVAATVVHGDGSPAAGLAVTLTSAARGYAAQTGVGGLALFADIPVGAYTLRAVEPRTGHPASADVVVVQDQTTPQTLTLIGVGAVQVQASFANGPAAGAEVQIQDALHAFFRLTGLTNSSGALTIADVPAGAFTVRVVHPRIGTVTRDAGGEVPAAGGTVTVNVTLPTAVAVPSVVGLPQGDAEVALAAAGLSVGPITSEYSPSVAAGAVIRHDPTAGTYVLEGAPVALVVSLGVAPVCRPWPAGIVSFWTADGSGQDLAGGHHAIPVGSVSYETAKVGQGFRLRNSVMRAPGPYDLGALNEVTFEGWVKVNASTGESGVFSAEGCCTFRVLISGSDIVYNPGLHNSDVRVSAGLQVGQFYHVAMTVKGGSTAKIYVNGTLLHESAADVPAELPNPSAILIGAGESTSAHLLEDGIIDEVAVYSRALSAAEIRAIYVASGIGKCRTRPPGIQVVSGTYGGNCAAPRGNATTPLAEACHGYEFCEYTVDSGVLGDPAPGCAKDYVAEWRCDAGSVLYRRTLAPEAGTGQIASLTCRPSDIVPPAVAAIVPAHQAIQVDPATQVQVTFTKPISVATNFANLISVAGPSGAIPGTTALVPPDKATFTPAAPLSINASYGVTVDGAVDLLGIRQAVVFNSIFKTPDTIAPTLSLSSPAPASWVKTARPVVFVALSDTLSGLDMPTSTLAIDGLAVTPVRGTNSLTYTPTADLGEGSHAVAASVADRAGNVGTLAASFGVDTVAPAPAQVTGVTDEQLLRGNVTLGAASSDAGSGLDRIEIQRDGAALVTVRPPPLSTTVDTRTWAEGPHILTARAVDVAGNVGSFGPVVHVVVDNQDLVVSVPVPTEGARFAGSVLVKASVSEVVERVEFQLGAQLVADTTAPYEATLDLTGTTEGTVAIVVTAFGSGVAPVTLTRHIVVDRTPPLAPDAAKISAEPPDISGLSLVFGQAAAVEAQAVVEATNPARGTNGSGTAGSDGSFVLSLGALPDDVLSLVAVDGAGNRSPATPITVRQQPTPVQGTVSIAYEGLLVDRVGPGAAALAPDGSLDAVFTISLSVGNGVTRQLSFIDLSGPGLRSTRVAVGAVLGVANDLWAPFRNAPDGQVSFPITTSATLRLFAADAGFVQEGATYVVSMHFADGSRFVGTLTATNVFPWRDAVGMVVSVLNRSVQPEAGDVGEAVGPVVSVRNAAPPPENGGSVGEAVGPVVSVRNTSVATDVWALIAEAVGPVVSVRNTSAAPDVGIGESVGPVVSVKNVPLPPPVTAPSPAASGPEPPAGSFVPTGSMASRRVHHTATALLSGQVLVAGGFDGNRYLSTAEIYDSATDRFHATGSMVSARTHHAAAPLNDGRVLVLGGYDGAADLSSLEIYDPATGAFAGAGTMTSARRVHTATRLPDGRVLVIGGIGAGAYLATAEICDASTRLCARTGSMASARAGHTATLLADGTVLVVGGLDGTRALRSAEIYDPAAGLFHSAGAMAGARVGHSASALADGTVLLAGGYEGLHYLSTAEIFEPSTGTFLPAGSRAVASWAHTATVTQGQGVLIAGGSDGARPLHAADLYVPERAAFAAAGSLAAARAGHTATALPDGRILLVGGIGIGNREVLDSAEVYVPRQGRE